MNNVITDFSYCRAYAAIVNIKKSILFDLNNFGTDDKCNIWIFKQN